MIRDKSTLIGIRSCQAGPLLRRNDRILDRAFGERGSGEKSTERYARIISASGATPPFVYTGQEVAPSATPGVFTDVSPGQDLSGNGFCLREQSRPGAAKIPEGTVVRYRMTGEGWWEFDANGWLGTYG